MYIIADLGTVCLNKSWALDFTLTEYTFEASGNDFYYDGRKVKLYR